MIARHAYRTALFGVRPRECGKWMQLMWILWTAMSGRRAAHIKCERSVSQLQLHHSHSHSFWFNQKWSDTIHRRWHDSSWRFKVMLIVHWNGHVVSAARWYECRFVQAFALSVEKPLKRFSSLFFLNDDLSLFFLYFASAKILDMSRNIGYSISQSNPN